MNTVTLILRIEGLAVGLAGIALYALFQGNWLFLVPLWFVPDISIAGYLRGPRFGAFTYNLVHNWALSIALLLTGSLLNMTELALSGAILLLHVGMDRLLGYGLKYPTSFQETHLGRIGRNATKEPV